MLSDKNNEDIIEIKMNTKEANDTLQIKQERKKRSLSSTSSVSSDESTSSSSSVVPLHANKKLATLAKYKEMKYAEGINSYQNKPNEIPYNPTTQHQFYKSYVNDNETHQIHYRHHCGAERPTKIRKEDRMLERQRINNYTGYLQHRNVNQQQQSTSLYASGRFEKAKEFTRKANNPSYINCNNTLMKSHLPLANNLPDQHQHMVSSTRQYLNDNNLHTSSTCSSTSSTSLSPPPLQTQSSIYSTIHYPPAHQQQHPMIPPPRHASVDLFQNILPYYLNNLQQPVSTKHTNEPTVAAAAAAAVTLANNYLQQKIFHQILQQQHHFVPNQSHYQNYLPQAIQQRSIVNKQLPKVICKKNSETDQVKEHFKRSLGFDCDDLLFCKQAEDYKNKKQLITSVPRTSITKIKNLDVEDHFIKSLGADYLNKIKKANNSQTVENASK